MEALTLLGSALTIIGTLVGGGVWLMKMNFRLGQQTLKAKKDLYEERFQNLKGVIENLQNRLVQHEIKLEETSKRLVVATSALEKNEKHMVNYVDSTEKKIASFETAVVKLSNDLIMLKTKPKGQP